MVLQVDFPPNIRVEKEISSLIRLGHRVYVLCPNYSNRKRFEHINGYDVYRIRYLPWTILNVPFGKLLNHPFPFNVIWMLYISITALKTRAHAIHVNNFPLLLPSFVVSKLLNIRLIFDSRENYPEYLRDLNQPKTLFNFLFNNPLFYKLIQKWLLRHIDIMITTNKHMGFRMRRIYNYRGRLYTIPNYCGKGLYEQGKDLKYNPSLPLIIGYVGGIDASRGLFEVIDALSILKDKPIKLKIAGFGVLANELKEYIGKKGGNVEFLGKIGHKQIKEFLSTIHIGILPHKDIINARFASPNKLFEYSCFVPVVARDLLSIRGFFKKYKIGFLYNNKNELVEILTKIINNPGDLIELRNNARLFASKHIFEDTADKVFNEIYGTS